MTACGRDCRHRWAPISAADIRSVVPDAEVAPPLRLARRSPCDLRSGRAADCRRIVAFSSRPVST